MAILAWPLLRLLAWPLSGTLALLITIAIPPQKSKFRPINRRYNTSVQVYVTPTFLCFTNLIDFTRPFCLCGRLGVMYSTFFAPFLCHEICTKHLARKDHPSARIFFTV